MTGYFTPGSVPTSDFIVQTQGQAGPSTPVLSRPIPDQQNRGQREAVQTGTKAESSADALEGRNAAGGKLGKRRAVVPSTENVLFSEEPQLCGCG